MGIAEGHSVTFAAGMAKEGMLPFCNIYSAFAQRAYDNIIHDVAISCLNVVFCIDRGGLVGEDGETHQGVFDVGFLDSVPGMTVLAPANFAELERMLRDAVLRYDGPVALRFPRGGEGDYKQDSGCEDTVVLRQGSDITLVAYGIHTNHVLATASRLEEHGIRAEVIKLNTITPIVPEEIVRSVRKTGALLVAEDCVASGSVGERISSLLAREGVCAKIALVNSGTSFVTHGKTALLEQQLGLDPVSLCRKAMEVLKHG